MQELTPVELPAESLAKKLLSSPEKILLVHGNLLTRSSETHSQSGTLNLEPKRGNTHERAHTYRDVGYGLAQRAFHPAVLPTPRRSLIVVTGVLHDLFDGRVHVSQTR